MLFDSVLLTAVTDELQKVIQGAHVDKVAQPEPLDIVLSVFKSGVRTNILFSAEPESARAHITQRRGRKSPTNPPAFNMLLRKYFEGGLVEEVAQPLGFSERVLRLTIRSAAKERTFLWIELMGRQSNIILTNEDGLILGCLKRVTSEMSRVRPIRAGIAYTPPPKQLGLKRDPMEPSASFALEELTFATVSDAEKWLISTFRGVGSLLAKEAVLRRPHNELTTSNIWFGLNEILNHVRLSEFAPVVFRDVDGQLDGVYPIPLRSVPEHLQTPFVSISEAIETAFSSERQENVLEKERTALLSALRKASKTIDRQVLDVREGLVNSEQSERLRQNGELLLANVRTIGESSGEVVVDDYYDNKPGSRRTIKIDPALSFQENAERYFKKFQKARDSVEILQKREEDLTRAQLKIERALVDAENATTVQELAALAESVGNTLLPQQAPAGHEKAQKPTFEGYKIKSIKSPDGWEILVGENSTSNDYLTTKVASPSDIWLHARAVPSAHAVIRAQNRPASVSIAAILLAAEQVARRSQAKHASVVSVDYTLRKYVRKPRGSAPGQVTYANEKTVDVVAADE